LKNLTGGARPLFKFPQFCCLGALATSFTMIYFKPNKIPQLLAKKFPTKDESHAPLTHAEFLTRAWKAPTL
jgi:hypothetical protein